MRERDYLLEDLKRQPLLVAVLCSLAFVLGGAACFAGLWSGGIIR